MEDGVVDDMHQDMHEDRAYRRVEMITGRRQRRSWTDAEKAEIVAASAEVGVNISAVGRQYGVSRGLLSVWRRQAGVTGDWDGLAPSFVPITVAAADDAEVDACTGSAFDPSRPRRSASPEGRIELELAGARLVVTGGVAPALAAAVISALRGLR